MHEVAYTQYFLREWRAKHIGGNRLIMDEAAVVSRGRACVSR